MPGVPDIGPKATWQALSEEPDAALVDVRTDAERAWVGQVPGAVPLAWKQWPSMAMNPDFDARLQAVAEQEAVKKIVLLCRSGLR